MGAYRPVLLTPFLSILFFDVDPGIRDQLPKRQLFRECRGCSPGIRDQLPKKATLPNAGVTTPVFAISFQKKQSSPPTDPSRSMEITVTHHALQHGRSLRTRLRCMCGILRAAPVSHFACEIENYGADRSKEETEQSDGYAFSFKIIRVAFSDQP